MKKKNLTIVGAGISGLYLAHLLEEQFDIRIIEARERIGGRVSSLDGHDMGPSWIWSHHKNILSLISSQGLKLFPQYSEGYALYDTQGKVELFSAPPSAPSARVEGSLTELINKLHISLQTTKIIYNEQLMELQEREEKIFLKTQKASYESDYLIITLPPRLAAKISYTPELPKGLLSQMQETQTWMGNSAKCVIEFKTPFWREKGLSGFAFSHLGPLGEIHDACTKERAALFGFINLKADMQSLKEDVKVQMQRIFGVDRSEILKIYVVDWKEEIFTSVKEDSKSLSTHPKYGIETLEYSKRVLFSSTEFSAQEGGYLEGAIINAKKIATLLHP
jgi:monoamine oxidase